VTDPPQPIPGPDEALVVQLKAGSAAAFAAMVRSLSPGMIRVARGYVSTPGSAAEVVQDTWLAVIEGIDGFAGRSSLRTWVYRILVNTAQRRGTREGRTTPFSSLANSGGRTVDPQRFQAADEEYPGHWREFPSPWPTPVSTTPEQQTLSQETRSVLNAALDRLPDRQRMVITLRDVQGLTSDEVCEALDITAANQRVLLHRARAFVRGQLEQYFEPGPHS
jgi:RNA polymerase sigma-70 factor (ECF subfamily)